MIDHVADFPSIFCKIKNKPNKDYADSLIFEDFDLSNISYPIENMSKHLREYPEAEGIEKAISNCLNFKENTDNPFLLVSGDLSGIQDTVYTISSKGALKSLRARSFMLEFLCEHVCYELVTNVLGDYKIYRNHVIFNGGGSFCLILPNTNCSLKAVENIKKNINDWAFNEFGGKLFLALESIELNIHDVKINGHNEDFRKIWNELTGKLEIDKKKKFNWKLNEIFDEKKLKEPIQKTNSEECYICHKDDLIISEENPFYDLNDFQKKNINTYDKLKSKSEETNWIHDLCFQLLVLGDDLINAKYIIRLKEKPVLKKYYLGGYLKLPSYNNYAYYYVGNNNKVDDYREVWEINGNSDEKPAFYYANYVTPNNDLSEEIRNRAFERYKNNLKNINQPEDKILRNFNNSTADFESLAESAYGADMIACLRMDVDDMGKILGSELEEFNLVTMSNLSRMLNIFFKIHITKICEGQTNDNSIEVTNLMQKDYTTGRKVSIVYSGGDDLFIVGAWDEVAELAYDIQRCFNKFSGLGISAGLTLYKPDYPLYQMAKLSEDALKTAKNEFDKKNRFAPFYTNELSEYDFSIRNKIDEFLTTSDRSHKISETFLFAEGTGKDDYKRIYFSIPWNKFENNCFDMTKMLLETDPEIPNADIYKLFDILETWYIDEGISLPKLMWILKDFEKYKLKTTIIDHFKGENIKSFHLPLIWYNYLRR